MIRNAVLVVTITAAIAGFLAWRAVATASAEPPHYAVLIDRSLSSLAACVGVEAATARMLDGRELRRGSSLTLLGTGDSSIAPEPRWIWSGDLPVDTRVFEGRARRVQQRRQFVDQVSEQCRKTSSTSSSPIFLGVKRALEQLRALGCGPDSQCALYVSTDGEENVEPHLRRAIDSSSRPAVIPPPLANDGVRVLFCGLAETRQTGGRARGPAPAIRSPERADRLRQVWAAAFSDPELVVFEPFCRPPTAN